MPLSLHIERRPTVAASAEVPLVRRKPTLYYVPAYVKPRTICNKDAAKSVLSLDATTLQGLLAIKCNNTMLTHIKLLHIYYEIARMPNQSA